MPFPSRQKVPLRAAGAQEGRHQGFSPLANHPFSFRTRFARKGKWRFGIAARPPKRVSKSGILPRRGAHRAPTRHPAGASPSRKRQAQTLHRQHPRPRGQAQDRTGATLSQIKFFHRMWTNLFAVAGTREHPPAGVIRKRGLDPLLCAVWPRTPAAAGVQRATARRAALSESE